MMPETMRSFPTLRSAYGGLTKAERRIADYIAAHPVVMMEQTVADIAMATDSSDVTISRFCKKIGCSGLKELKLLISAELVGKEKEGTTEIQNTDETQAVAEKIFQSVTDGLQDTLSLLSYERIDNAANVLQQARRVLVFGFGNSATVCRDLATRFMRLGLSITAYEDSHMQVTAAALASPDDVVIAVSHSGASLDLLQSVEAAKEQGATIIAITSHGQSPLAKAADICLCGMGREVRYSSEAGASRLIHMAIGDVLYTRMAMNKPEQFQENMERMRRQIQQKKR